MSIQSLNHSLILMYILTYNNLDSRTSRSGQESVLSHAEHSGDSASRTQWIRWSCMLLWYRIFFLGKQVSVYVNGVLETFEWMSSLDSSGWHCALSSKQNNGILNLKSDSLKWHKLKYQNSFRIRIISWSYQREWWSIEWTIPLKL